MTEPQHGLGRVHVTDTRDANYPMRAVIDRHTRAGAARRTKRTWTPRARPVLDQGQTPTCVGHAFTHWYTDGPVTHRKPLPYSPIDLYDRAQTVDGISGPHEGTTGRAAATILRTIGVIGAYHNAESFQDVIDALLYVGPVCVGTGWTEDMFESDRNNFLRLSGAIVGGHEYVLNAIDLRGEWIELKNSWGTGWGRRGFAKVHLGDYANFWAESEGDAILATERDPISVPVQTGSTNTANNFVGAVMLTGAGGAA